MYKIKVIDAICGKGKSSAMINYINESDDSTKFLYITPFLDEVQRIKEQCSSKNFYEPIKLGSKLNGIKELFKKGRNIVSTHSLFSHFDQETIELAYLNNYVLIMDEVANVVEPLCITQYDLKTILENYAKVNEKGQLEWYATDYKGEFDKYKRLADLGCVTIYSNSAFLWMFPISVFKAFHDVYILTYLFEAQMQCYYYKYYDVEYEYLYVNDFHITTEPQEDNIEIYKKLINIYDNAKANSIGDLDYTLTASWYQRNSKSKILFEELKKKTTSYFKNVGTASNDNMWTCFKEFNSEIGGNGYRKGFISLGSRATNQYIHKKSLAYLVNIYFNPIIKQFFISRNIKINEDLYALSEMLQWIFRSQLRDKKPINLYLPSNRMRNLLINFLDNNIDDKIIGHIMNRLNEDE